jgi:hypothetical protein
MATNDLIDAGLLDQIDALRGALEAAGRPIPIVALTDANPAAAARSNGVAACLSRPLRKDALDRLLSRSGCGTPTVPKASL